MSMDLPRPQTLDEVRALIARLPGPDTAMVATVRDRDRRLTKPAGALGRLEEITAFLAGWQRRALPRIDRPRVAVFAGNHGVAAQGVSAFPPDVTAQMVENFVNGGAAINQICRTMDAELRVLEVAVELPTNDFSRQPAMDDADCAEAMAFGMSVVERGIDVLCPGEMGIGNTTAAAALCHALYGGRAEDWTGSGTGVAAEAWHHKVRIVGDAVLLHEPVMTDGLEILRCVGGRELAAIAGAVIAARLMEVPVVLDGYVSTASAAVLERMRPGALDHCLIGHVSAEPGHRRLLEKLDKPALLDLNMRLGEGTGAALAIGLLRSACACHAGMATFEEAQVSEKGEDRSSLSS